MEYYYFAATLPSLTMDAPPPLSLEDYRALCREYLRATDSRTLEDLLDPSGPASEHPFVRRWREEETQLRNALVKRRAETLNRDGTEALREQQDYDSAVEDAAANAFLQRTPLIREQALDRFRWQQIEALAGFDPFSAESLFAYGLKLQLVERWAGIEDTEGRKKFEALVARDPESSSGSSKDKVTENE